MNSLPNNARESDPQDDNNKTADVPAAALTAAATATAAISSHPATFEHRIHPCASTPPGRVDHTYRDFSHYPNDGNFKGKRLTSNFPAKLHMILSNPAYSHFITWMPHGRAWKILNKELFMKEVVPNYFVQAKYESFTRQLSGWGFKHLYQSGPDFKAYYHECFLRGLPHLTRLMKRPSHSGKLMPCVEGEPNFYHMSEQYPLPLGHASSVVSEESSSYTLYSKSVPALSHPPPPTTYDNVKNPSTFYDPSHSGYQNYLPSNPTHYGASYNAHAHQPPPHAHEYQYPPQYSPHQYAPPDNCEAYPPAHHGYPSPIGVHSNSYYASPPMPMHPPPPHHHYREEIANKHHSLEPLPYMATTQQDQNRQDDKHHDGLDQLQH